MTKPSYEELEAQIEALKTQNEALLERNAIYLSGKRIYYYSEILNTIGDPVFVKDDESRILLVNDAFCDLFNLPRESVIGKTLAEHVPENEREQFLTVDKQVIKNGIEDFRIETLTLEEKNTKIISTRKSRFLDDEGNRYLVGIIRDITDLKASEVQYKKLNDTKDTLFSIIGHDLRSPINIIQGFAEILLEGESTPEEAEKYHEFMYTSAKDTITLLQNLLEWAKTQTGQLKLNLKTFNLYDNLIRISSIYEGQFKQKDISFSIDVPADLEIRSDKHLLDTVVRNLLTNALKFTNHEGNISIKGRTNQDTLELTVSDSGIGIPDETIPHLFKVNRENTNRGTDNEKGSGLGLVLCKEFIDMLSGTIEVKSEVNKGTDFIISIPK